MDPLPSCFSLTLADGELFSVSVGWWECPPSTSGSSGPSGLPGGLADPGPVFMARSLLRQHHSDLAACAAFMLGLDPPLVFLPRFHGGRSGSMGDAAFLSLAVSHCTQLSCEEHTAHGGCWSDSSFLHLWLSRPRSSVWCQIAALQAPAHPLPRAPRVCFSSF